MTDFSPSGDDAESFPTAGDGQPTDQTADTDSRDRVALDARLSALERAVTGGETDLHTLADTAAQETRLDEIASRIEEVERRVDELDAAVQALRGYVGAVRAVNRDVERRADAALAVADRLAAGDAVTDLDLPEPSTGTDGETGGGPPTDDERSTGEDRPGAGGWPAGDRLSTEEEQTTGGPSGETAATDDDLADRVRDLL